MDKPVRISVPDQVREFIGSRLVPPSVIVDPVSGAPTVVEPAGYDFDEPHSAEYERIARAASAASGIVPSAEDLTAQAMAAVAERARPQAG